MQDQTYYSFEELLALLQDDPDKAMTGLMLFYRPIIKQTLLFWVNDPQQIEELFLLTMESLWKNSQHFQSLENHHAWVKRVAINHAKNARKIYNRRKTTQVDFLQLVGTSDAALDLEAKELLNQINHAIESLPPHEKQVVEYSIRFNLSNKDIAIKLNRSESTIRTQLQQGLLKIRKAIGLQ